MTTFHTSKHYRLDDAGTRQAELKGLVAAPWFTCHLGRQQLKQLMQRSDRPAMLQLGLWLLLLASSGALALWTWTATASLAWSIPAFLVYGMLYSASDHSAHELSHGTPFKTAWLNAVFYQLASFMTLHEPVFWRWSHARHHTDTIIVGRDREIAFPRPVNRLLIALDFLFLPSGIGEISRTVRHALRRVGAEASSFVPASELDKMVCNSRIYLALYVGLVGWCLVAGSILPALFFVLPRFYGGWLAQLFNITQHAGLAEDVLDHRLNTRSMRLNPVFEFLYMKMNYHVEHHMYPMVPFHALPALHAAIKAQTAPGRRRPIRLCRNQSAAAGRFCTVPARQRAHRCTDRRHGRHLLHRPGNAGAVHPTQPTGWGTPLPGLQLPGV